MARIVVAAPNRTRRIEPLLVVDGAQELQRMGHVLRIVERQRRVVLGETFAVGVLGVGFLIAGRIKEQDLREFGRGGRAVDRTAKARLYEARQVPDVVDVRVREHHRVDALLGERQILPIAEAQLFETLKEPAIDQHARVFGFQQILGTGDGFGGAVERDVEHGWFACGERIRGAMRNSAIGTLVTPRSLHEAATAVRRAKRRTCRRRRPRQTTAKRQARATTTFRKTTAK